MRAGRISAKRQAVKAADRGRRKSGQAKRIRYALVGLGHTLKQLQGRYKVRQAGSYDQYDSVLADGEIDAVFIAEPNSLHCDFAVRAAEAGVHVLCEKPLAVTEEECERMIQAARRNRVKLMTAYRLHFERANLEAIELVQSGKIGEPRFFSSVFSMQAKEGNIRLRQKLGGGTLYDLGVYCINAARYLFRSEPNEIFAFTANNGDKRFREVEEMTGALLRFPGDRLASFICSFGAADIANYDIVGTEGTLHLKMGYEYAMPIEWELSIGEKTESRKFSKRDQFAPELIYFSDCIVNDKEPEPSGVEGATDVRIIRRLYESARKGAPVRLRLAPKGIWPGMHQQMKRPPVRKPPKQIDAEDPSQG